MNKTLYIIAAIGLGVSLAVSNEIALVGWALAMTQLMRLMKN